MKEMRLLPFMAAVLSIIVSGCSKDNDDENGFVVEYNVSLKKGWNIMYSLFEYKDRNGDGYPDYVKATVSNKTPSGLKWWAS